MLDLNTFSFVNAARCDESFPRCKDWIPEQWSNAALGELGEAANLIKKLNRAQLPGDFKVTKEQIIEELADTVTYIDLLVTKLGGNLDQALVEKFNKVSSRVNSKRFLEIPE